jgi:hypothetical protein
VNCTGCSDDNARPKEDLRARDPTTRSSRRQNDTSITITVLPPDSRATFRTTDPAGNVYATTGRLVTVAAPDGVTNANAESFAVPAGRAPASDPCGDGQVRCFNPVFYAVDAVVPLVTLGQLSTWYPKPRRAVGNGRGHLLNIATLLGWVLSSIFLQIN